MRGLPHRSPSGNFDGILATFVNVTSVPEAELRQRVLIEELNYRVRNMLTVVTSIANRTAPDHHQGRVRLSLHRPHPEHGDGYTVVAGSWRSTVLPSISQYKRQAPSLPKLILMGWMLWRSDRGPGGCVSLRAARLSSVARIYRIEH